MIPRGLKYTLCLAPLLLIAVCVVVGEKHLRHREPLRICSSVDVKYIERHGGCLPEVDPDEISGRIASAVGTILGRRFEEISLDAIEKALEESSVIASAQAWATDDGTLHLDLKRRMPVMWLQDGEKGWLVDRTGYGFVLPGWDANGLPKVEGPFISAPELTGEVLLWMEEMKKYGLWEMGPQEISVSSGGDISFSLGERGEKVLFGNPDNAGSKASRLRLYYSSILPYALENGKNYQSIDLKYDRQIVCR